METIKSESSKAIFLGIDNNGNLEPKYKLVGRDEFNVPKEFNYTSEGKFDSKIEYETAFCQYSNHNNLLTVCFVVDYGLFKQVATTYHKDITYQKALEVYSKLNDLRIKAGGESIPMKYIEFKEKDDKIILVSYYDVTVKAQ